MGINKKTYQPVQAVTVKATEDLPAFRFVSVSGGLCGDAERALGVTETDWINGEYAAVVTLGNISVEASGAIPAGSDVTSDTDGKAKLATTGNPVNGRAIEGCSSAGEFVKIKLVP